MPTLCNFVNTLKLTFMKHTECCALVSIRFHYIFAGESELAQIRPFIFHFSGFSLVIKCIAKTKFAFT